MANKEINGGRFFDGSGNYTFACGDSARVSSTHVYSMRDTQFSGTVTSAATQTQVSYNGKVGALVQSDATFQLTSERGSATYKVTADEALSYVVDPRSTIPGSQWKSAATTLC